MFILYAIEKTSAFNLNNSARVTQALSAKRFLTYVLFLIKASTMKPIFGFWYIKYTIKSRRLMHQVRHQKWAHLPHCESRGRLTKYSSSLWTPWRALIQPRSRGLSVDRMFIFHQFTTRNQLCRLGPILHKRYSRDHKICPYNSFNYGGGDPAVRPLRRDIFLDW